MEEYISGLHTEISAIATLFKYQHQFSFYVYSRMCMVKCLNNEKRGQVDVARENGLI